MKTYQECMDCKCEVDDPVTVDTGLCEHCYSLKRFKLTFAIVILSGVGLAGVGTSVLDISLKIILTIALLLATVIIYQNSQD